MCDYLDIFDNKTYIEILSVKKKRGLRGSWEKRRDMSVLTFRGD